MKSINLYNFGYLTFSKHRSLSWPAQKYSFECGWLAYIKFTNDHLFFTIFITWQLIMLSFESFPRWEIFTIYSSNVFTLRKLVYHRGYQFNFAGNLVLAVCICMLTQQFVGGEITLEISDMTVSPHSALYHKQHKYLFSNSRMLVLLER